MKFATLPDLPSDDDEDDSDYSTQTDEQMLRDMMHEDDESEYNDSEADGQTAEELLEELKEEHGTVTSPTRCGSVLPLHFVSNLAARHPVSSYIYHLRMLCHLAQVHLKQFTI